MIIFQLAQNTSGKWASGSKKEEKSLQDYYLIKEKDIHLQPLKKKRATTTNTKTKPKTKKQEEEEPTSSYFQFLVFAESRSSPLSLSDILSCCCNVLVRWREEKGEKRKEVEGRVKKLVEEASTFVSKMGSGALKRLLFSFEAL